MGRKSLDVVTIPTQTTPTHYASIPAWGEPSNVILTFIAESRRDLPNIITNQTLQPIGAESIQHQCGQGGAKTCPDHVTHGNICHVRAYSFFLSHVPRFLKLHHNFVEGGAYLSDDDLL